MLGGFEDEAEGEYLTALLYSKVRARISAAGRVGDDEGGGEGGGERREGEDVW